MNSPRGVADLGAGRFDGPAEGLPPNAARRFPRSHRLRKRPDFVRVQGQGVRVSARHALLLVQASSAASLGRVGIVASRKTGNAVVRNRAKRLVREVFRLHPELLPSGVDVVVIVRPGLADLRLAQLESELVPLARLVRKRALESLPLPPRTQGPPALGASADRGPAETDRRRASPDRPR